jgi:hypothetical protein
MRGHPAPSGGRDHNLRNRDVQVLNHGQAFSIGR